MTTNIFQIVNIFEETISAASASRFIVEQLKTSLDEKINEINDSLHQSDLIREQKKFECAFGLALVGSSYLFLEANLSPLTFEALVQIFSLLLLKNMCYSRSVTNSTYDSHFQQSTKILKTLISRTTSDVT